MTDPHHLSWEALCRELDSIPALSAQDSKRARAHLDQLTKPPGSLGRLEDLAARYAAIKGVEGPRIQKKAVVLFAADHGVVAEGVSAYPQEVTAQMVMNILNGGAAISVLARHTGAALGVVDVGVCGDLEPLPGLTIRKVAPGTRNMMREPAMERRQAEQALVTGWRQARERIDQGVDVLATGEMGIGNTTAASAVLAALGNLPPARVTGPGTGVDGPVLQKKIAVIEQAIARHRPDPLDPVDVLVKVGGLEIAAIAGLILGAARCRTPVVVDGLISGAGAAVALKLRPQAAPFLFASHRSTEPGHAVFFNLLGEEPILDLGMRLGEGTGAVLAMHLLEGAVKIYSEMATFDSAGVSRRPEPERGDASAV